MTKCGLCRRAALLAPRTASSVAPVANSYERSLRPCLGTIIAPRRRATFRQTLLSSEPEVEGAVEQALELGARILGPIERLEDVCEIVRHCHEHWDGSGYPDGLSGDDIPVESRVVLVCDAYHAMTTDRPYRKRLPTEEARRRLREAAGTQFDPRVVEVFLRLGEPLRAVRAA